MFNKDRLVGNGLNPILPKDPFSRNLGEGLNESIGGTFSKNIYCQTNGGPPYYYEGERYDDKATLYFGILMDKASEQLGIKDGLALLAKIFGSTTENKRFVTSGSSKGTSVLSRELGDQLGHSAKRIPTITDFTPRVTYTKSIGRAVARWLPLLG